MLNPYSIEVIYAVVYELCKFLQLKMHVIFFFNVLGLAAVHATAMVVVSWILDPGVKGDHKHFKL